jgi:acyl dehydratase
MQPTPIASRQVTAHNDAMDSGNPMHVDETARAMNFKAALVSGVTVFGYMTHALVSYFGAAWLERGCMQVRFRRPVYAGDSLWIESELRDAASDAQVIDLFDEKAMSTPISISPYSPVAIRSAW